MQVCDKFLCFVVVLMALNSFLFFLTKFLFKVYISVMQKVSELMNDTNWVKRHCNFLKIIHF